MSLSKEAREILVVAMANAKKGKEVADAIDAVQAASAVVDLNQDITATYVEAEVQAISDKVDEILAALRLSGAVQS